MEVTHKNTDGDELHDFIGATTAVDESLWEFPHVYRLEWYPSRASQGGGTYGYVRWELDGRLLANIDAYALRGRIGEGGDGSKYVISDRKISQEPMYMLFNVAISEFWKHQVHILPKSRYHARTHSHSLMVYRMFGHSGRTHGLRCHIG